ncbi:unnamed protein product [Nesidiocoris tenuis]|uniref:Uncharacterized protein n=1 Tax=Nesidiocoris tenuis TaxID=355587 RepID=A0A6H5H5N3_9HEMI|nr:unnamed protein product [Nesidiocoris tenuis]
MFFKVKLKLYDQERPNQFIFGAGKNKNKKHDKQTLVQEVILGDTFLRRKATLSRCIWLVGTFSGSEKSLRIRSSSHVLKTIPTSLNDDLLVDIEFGYAFHGRFSRDDIKPKNGHYRSFSGQSVINQVKVIFSKGSARFRRSFSKKKAGENIFVNARSETTTQLTKGALFLHFSPLDGVVEDCQFSPLCSFLLLIVLHLLVLLLIRHLIFLLTVLELLLVRLLPPHHLITVFLRLPSTSSSSPPHHPPPHQPLIIRLLITPHHPPPYHPLILRLPSPLLIRPLLLFLHHPPYLLLHRLLITSSSSSYSPLLARLPIATPLSPCPASSFPLDLRRRHLHLLLALLLVLLLCLLVLLMFCFLLRQLLLGFLLPATHDPLLFLRLLTHLVLSTPSTPPPPRPPPPLPTPARPPPTPTPPPPRPPSLPRFSQFSSTSIPINSKSWPIFPFDSSYLRGKSANASKSEDPKLQGC